MSPDWVHHKQLWIALVQKYQTVPQLIFVCCEIGPKRVSKNRYHSIVLHKIELNASALPVDLLLELLLLLLHLLFFEIISS